MKKLFSKAVSAVFMCSLFMAAELFSAPSLEFSSSEVDFGSLGPVETAARTVSIRNAGSVPVHIVRAKACCGAKASVSAANILPSESVELRVSVTTGARPGPFRKTVTVISDDAERPMFTITLVGSVRKTMPVVQGDDVVLVDNVAAADLPHFPGNANGIARLSLTVPAVVLAGFVDGFNPCSFAIMISLAGILAIGGRKRRARILGGLSFCAGSFVTYMLMGFGLLQALKALQGLRILHDVMQSLLALALFVLSFLSFRDALRFHRVPVLSVVTLKLPECVKNAIRRIALSSWSGSAVVLAGFACAFLVTLLDALCTGQVYVPVLALLAKEQASSRAAMLLVLYNLAFIAPLVGVFILASKTTDAFQMAKWSSRNVIPAKIALGFVFAFLGWILWPRLDIPEFALDDIGIREGDVANPSAAGTDNAEAGFDKVKDNRRKVLSEDELADGNERLDELLRAPQIDPAFPRLLASVVSDRTRDEQWRNHCLQIIPDCMMRLDKDTPEMGLLSATLAKALKEHATILPGTALLGYARLSEANGTPSSGEVSAMAVSIASDASSVPENVVTALRVCVELGERSVLPAARYWARRGGGQFLRSVAVSALRDLGGREDAIFLRSLLPARSKAEEVMIKGAIERLEAER